MCVLTLTTASVAANVIANVAAGAAIAGSVASAGIGIAGSIQQGNAAKKQAKYEYQVAQYEAELARQEGRVEQIRHGVDARRAYGKAVVGAARYGGDLGFGSPKRNLVEIRKFQALEQNIIARNADNAVLGAQLRGQEALSRGRNAKMASTYQAVSAGVQGVANLAGITYGLSERGAFDNLGKSSASRLTRSSSPYSARGVRFRGN